MGQKVHPVGFRLGNYRQWNSRWFAKNEYPDLLLEDRQIRDFIKQEKELEGAGIAAVDIERAANKVKIKIYTSRPGIVIGQKGRKIEDLRRKLEKRIGRDLIIDIQEVRKPETNAQLVAENIALQLQRRVAFRRAMKKAVGQAMKFGVQGIKVRVAGRLGGAEMARKEWYRLGRVPLHTLRADIDYGFAEAKTTYGVIGVKTWIFKGEILAEEQLIV
ncbi:MAG: 30S ribosomal protein S3 [Deltaproteobacteria bacterium]|nr:30S ribosomal protein S3 [Deltaproteobacteria bacterium]MBW1952790.1 30S ribosomal protein S3 [Deltaproteobacteria bacterium]MBW1987109.1 30S ribosomal protein S3 [Deltaproteobacteria bacterium]MBW2135399.1 30S ribosomal protein S3 [Deltaproteobacteria bacterium]